VAGIYVRDTFDFRTTTGFEQLIPLGIWNTNRILSKAETALYVATASKGYNDFVAVYNSDFSSWQDRENEGGDFVVYSDVRWSGTYPSLQPQQIELP
jgi:hypothetical protein